MLWNYGFTLGYVSDILLHPVGIKGLQIHTVDENASVFRSVELCQKVQNSRFARTIIISVPTFTNYGEDLSLFDLKIQFV